MPVFFLFLQILNHYAIVYKVFDKTESMSEPRNQVLFTNFDFQNRTEYQVSITYNSENMKIAIASNMRSQYNNDAWDANPITLFAEQPETTLSIGGAPGGSSFFVGCISSLKIDEIEIPLSGLAFLSAEEGGFTYNSSNTVIEPYCNLCDLVNCPFNMTCASDNYGGTDCVCPMGYALDELVDSCIPIEISTVQVPSTVRGQPIDYITGGTVGGVLLIGAIIVIVFVFMVIVVLRLRLVKHNNRERACGMTSNSRRIINDSETFMALDTINTPKSHERGITISAFQDHVYVDDADSEIMEAPYTCLQQWNPTSAKSGTHANSARESTIRGTSTTDNSIASQESESDDSPVSLSVGMHPSDLTSSMMDMPTRSAMDVQVKVASPCIPLTTWDYRVTIPESDGIHVCIIEDDHQDTDSEILTDTSSLYCHAIYLNCPETRASDTFTGESDRDTPKLLYKLSMASDNEGDSDEALNATLIQSHPSTSFYTAAPDYSPPPSFLMRVNPASPVFAYSTTRFRPSMMHTTSPLTRSTLTFRTDPLSYTIPNTGTSGDTRQQASRGSMAIQHNISMPHWSTTEISRD